MNELSEKLTSCIRVLESCQKMTLDMPEILKLARAIEGVASVIMPLQQLEQQFRAQQKELTELKDYQVESEITQQQVENQ